MDITDFASNEMLTMLRERFTGEEQEMFIDSFKMYMQYTDDDFVIDLDNVWEWLGFSQKGGLKKVLLKHLTVDVHYKINARGFAITEENANDNGGALQFGKTVLGGQNKETLLLTIDGFKQLCMSANTPKAMRVRMYYINMEKVLHAYTNQQLKAAREQLQKQAHAVKTYEEVVKNEYIYITKELTESDNNLHKIGRTVDPRNRLKQHNTASAKGIVEVYKRAVSNAALAEKVIHGLLKKYSYHGNGGQEHFNCNTDYSQLVVDMVCTFIDTMYGSYHTISVDELIAKLKGNMENLIAVVPHAVASVETAMPENITNSQKEPEPITQHEEKVKVQKTQKPPPKTKIMPAVVKEEQPKTENVVADPDLSIATTDAIGAWLNKWFVRTTDMEDRIVATELLHLYRTNTGHNIHISPFGTIVKNIHKFESKRKGGSGVVLYCCIKPKPECPFYTYA